MKFISVMQSQVKKKKENKLTCFLLDLYLVCNTDSVCTLMKLLRWKIQFI